MPDLLQAEEGTATVVAKKKTKSRRKSVYQQVVTLFQPFAPRMLQRRLQEYAIVTSGGILAAGASLPRQYRLSDGEVDAGLQAVPEGHASDGEPLVRRQRSLDLKKRGAEFQRLQVDVTNLNPASPSGASPPPTVTRRPVWGSNVAAATTPSPMTPDLPSHHKMEPWSDPMHGAMLIIDVTGFTALTEKLSQDEGRMLSGEHLIACLNDYFHRIIHIVEEYGGDVIKFAGDAMIIFFDAGRSMVRQGAGRVGLAQRCLLPDPAFDGALAGF